MEKKIDFEDLKNAAKMLGIKTGGKSRVSIEQSIDLAIDELNDSLDESTVVSSKKPSVPTLKPDVINSSDLGARAVKSLKRPRGSKGRHPITREYL